MAVPFNRGGRWVRPLKKTKQKLLFFNLKTIRRLLCLIFLGVTLMVRPEKGTFIFEASLRKLHKSQKRNIIIFIFFMKKKGFITMELTSNRSSDSWEEGVGHFTLFFLLLHLVI